MGKGKQGLGEASDSDRMKREGNGQEARGEGEQLKGKDKDVTDKV